MAFAAVSVIWCFACSQRVLLLGFAAWIWRVQSGKLLVGEIWRGVLSLLVASLGAPVGFENGLLDVVDVVFHFSKTGFLILRYVCETRLSYLRRCGGEMLVCDICTSTSFLISRGAARVLLVWFVLNRLQRGADVHSKPFGSDLWCWAYVDLGLMSIRYFSLAAGSLVRNRW